MFLTAVAALAASISGVAQAQSAKRAIPVGARDAGSCHDYAIAHPERHLDGGYGAQSCLFQIPPRHLDSPTTTPEELRSWHISPRPDPSDGEHYAQWKKTFDQTTGRVLPKAYQGTWNLADFDGPPEVWAACGGSLDGKHLLPKDVPRGLPPSDPLRLAPD